MFLPSQEVMHILQHIWSNKIIEILLTQAADNRDQGKNSYGESDLSNLKRNKEKSQGILGIIAEKLRLSTITIILITAHSSKISDSSFL